MRSLKKILQKNELTVGSWISLPSSGIAEIMAKADFDWITVDMEHSPITLERAEELIRVIDLAGNTPLVRVGENDPLIIKRVMDAGSHGVIVPMINSEKEAVRAVESVKYPPEGKRGVGLARAQGHGMKFEEYKQWLSKESVVIVQIEHIDAIEDLEAILSVEGVDASMIGPYDLSASMGYPGEFQRKDVKEAVARYQEICKKVGKPSGFHCVLPQTDLVEQKTREGFTFIAYSLDALLLSTRIEEDLKKIK